MGHWVGSFVFSRSVSLCKDLGLLMGPVLSWATACRAGTVVRATGGEATGETRLQPG